MANSGTTGDTLSYTTAATGGVLTAPTGSIIASTGALTNVGTVGNNSHTPKTGSSGTVTWTLIDDPTYAIGGYSCVVLFQWTSV